ncbi:hypothetical protein F2Q69_00045951 [Brassica cretica]|uniref:Uncharacterized protein n=1 Tax=Brassica cretica TaxID=69181 RepID=A0A8S9PHP4_BRACR|nr:hypothetical protein F2Q69_00045951 [Brassica cretica]
MELALRNIRECTDLGRTRCSMFEIVRSLRSDRVLDGLVGRYVATDSIADRSLRSEQIVADRSLRSDRLVAGWSLRSDQPRGLVGRYVATDSLRIGRYVPNNRDAWSVAT